MRNNSIKVPPCQTVQINMAAGRMAKAARNDWHTHDERIAEVDAALALVILLANQYADWARERINSEVQ